MRVQDNSHGEPTTEAAPENPTHASDTEAERDVITRLFDMWEEIYALTRTSVSDQRGAYLHVLGKLNYAMLPLAVGVTCHREFGGCATHIMCTRNRICTYAPPIGSAPDSAQGHAVEDSERSAKDEPSHLPAALTEGRLSREQIEKTISRATTTEADRESDLRGDDRNG